MTAVERDDDALRAELAEAATRSCGWWLTKDECGYVALALLPVVLAYGERRAAEELRAAAEEMSNLHGRPEDYARWLRENAAALASGEQANPVSGPVLGDLGRLPGAPRGAQGGLRGNYGEGETAQ
jgi:hypothetical protein